METRFEPVSAGTSNCNGDANKMSDTRVLTWCAMLRLHSVGGIVRRVVCGPAKAMRSTVTTDDEDGSTHDALRR